MLDYLIARFCTDMTERPGEHFWSWIMEVNDSGRPVFSASFSDQETVLSSVAEYPTIADALTNRGCADARLEKIIGRNFANYIGRVCGA